MREQGALTDLTSHRSDRQAAGRSQGITLDWHRRVGSRRFQRRNFGGQPAGLTVPTAHHSTVKPGGYETIPLPRCAPSRHGNCDQIFAGGRLTFFSFGGFVTFSFGAFSAGFSTADFSTGGGGSGAAVASA